MNNKLLQSKTHSLRIRRGNRGFALPITMCAVLILLVLGLGVLSFGQHSRRFAVHTSSGMAARCAADAGLTQALYEMNKKVKALPWNNGSLPKVISETLPNSDSVFGYTVTGDLTNGHNLKSTGAYGLRQRTVRCSLPLQGLFEYALFGDQYVHLKSGGTLTCYNCDSDDKTLQIGTNSTLADTLDLKNAAIVNGDAVIGVGGDPGVVISDTSGGIKGNTYIMPKEHELPPITVPESLSALPSSGTIYNNTNISSSAKYDKIDLGNSKIITVKGEVSLYIVGDVILDNSAELRIINTNEASLILFVGGNIEIKNGGVINNLSEDSKKLQIYGLDSCQNLTLKNGGDFYGAIYAPNADVVMMNSGDMFGSVIGKSVEQKNSSTFHYDVSLRDVSIEDIGVRFVVKQWQEE